MTAIRLGVRCESKSKVLIFGLTRKPLLLFRNRRGIRPEESKSIETFVEWIRRGRSFTRRRREK